MHMCLVRADPLSTQGQPDIKHWQWRPRAAHAMKTTVVRLGSWCPHRLTPARSTPPRMCSGLTPSWNSIKQVLSWADCHETFRPCEATPQAVAGLPTPSPNAL